MKCRLILVSILFVGLVGGLRAAVYSCFDRIPRQLHNIYFKTTPYLAVDDNEWIFALDNREHAFYILSAYSDETLKVSGRGQGPGDLQFPSNVCFDLNRIFVADNVGISIFSREGKFINRFRVYNRLISFAVHGNKIFAAETGATGLIQTYDISGRAGKVFGSYYDYPRSLYKDKSEDFVEFLINAGKVLVGEKAVYFVSSLFDEIQVFDWEGTFIKRIAFGGEEAEKNKKFFFKTGQEINPQKFITNPLIMDACCRNGKIYLLHKGEKNPESSEIWEIPESDLKQVRKSPLRNADTDIKFGSCRSMTVSGNSWIPTLYISLYDEKKSEIFICLLKEIQ